MDAGRDFFVSYTAADRAWAEWLAWELNAAGYSTLLQAWDMPPGTAFAHAMDQAVQHTRHTVLVLSPAYLRSAMTEAEWRPGFVADPSGEDRRLLPVRIEPCEPKGLLADRVWIDLVGLDEATTRATLLDGVARAIRGPGPPTTRPRFPRAPAVAAVDRPRFPTALPPVWNLPFHRNPTFTGRDEVLASLTAALEQRGAAAITQVLQGGGGVGKTALATEYAYRQRARFDTVWWIRAEEPATLVGDYTDLAVALGLTEASQADQQLAAIAVRRWLEGSDRWLLIFDNAEAPDTSTGLEAPLDEVAGLLPQVVHGQMLITSRDASWEQHATLAELELFTPAEAVAFLLARSGSSDQGSATEVAELLGLLPLALEQAGAYVRETRLPLATYLDRLRRFPALTVAKGRPRDRDPARTVATTWQVSLERVRPVPGAVTVLEACAFLGPEEIPRLLFTEQLDPPADELDVLADNPFALDDAIAALRRFGLVKADEQTLTVHRLLQQVIRDSLDPDQQGHWAAIALRLIRAAFPAEHDNPYTWPTYTRLLPHVLAVSSRAEALDVDSQTTAWLLNQAGLYLWRRADHQQARMLFERTLSIREILFGRNHPIVAETLNSLGGVLLDLGDLGAGRDAHQRALTIREAHLGPDHPDTAESLGNLGSAYRRLGDYQAAKEAQQRALRIREAHLGPNHLAIAESLSNLGLTLRRLGDYQAAKEAQQRALRIREAHLGPDHPHTAMTVDNLGLTLRRLGDYQAAQNAHQRALRIREAHLGPDHPDTAESLGNLGLTLRRLGDYQAAQNAHQRALTIRETRLGPDHFFTAVSLSHLGIALHDLGQFETARDHLYRALRILELRLGPDHPNTVETLEALGLVLRDLGELPRAREYLERALAIHEARLGPGHPDTAHGLNNLAAVLYAQGDLDGARRLHERALRIREARLGADHPDTAQSRNNLALIWAALGDLEGARRLHEKALAVRRRVLGEDHPDTLTSMNNLAAVRRELDEL